MSVFISIVISYCQGSLSYCTKLFAYDKAGVDVLLQATLSLLQKQVDFSPPHPIP